LDPRTKLTAFKDIEKERVKNVIFGLTDYHRVLENEITLNTINEVQQLNTRAYFHHLHEHNHLLINQTSPVVPENNINTTTNTFSINVQNELARYLCTPLEDEIEPLDWWYAQRKEYPILSLIARDYLTVQATSVASEQSFSIAGQTITSQRNRLDSDTARASLCLKSWIHNELCGISI